MSDHIDFEIKILSCTDTCLSITYILLLFTSLCTCCHECNSLRKRVPKILRQLNVIFTIIFKLSATVIIHTVVVTASIKAITKCISQFCHMLLSLAVTSLGRHYMFTC